MENKIIDWLNTQGYPLEMRVARALQQQRLDVHQSIYYVDPDEGKPREIDVVADATGFIQDTIISVCYAVECKLSSDKPWLLFSRGELHDSATFAMSDSIAASSRARKDIGLNVRDFVARHSSIFSRDPVSYGLTTAFTSGTDVPYRALQTAIKAATWLAHRRPTEKDAFIFAIPVVVIDAKLYEVFLDRESVINVREVKSGTVRLQAKVGGLVSPWVKILTSPAIDEFAVEAARIANLAVQYCFKLLDHD